MELLFIRHAESIGNAQHIMQGRADFELSETGHKQAQILADYLSHCVPDAQQIDHIYCSPLQRAQQTLAPFLKLSQFSAPVLDSALVEVDSGIFSGLTWQEAGQQFPEDQARFKAARDWGVVPGGESKLQLWQRAQSWINHMQANHSNQRLLVMTHGGFIRAALSVLAAAPPEAPVFVCIDNTSLSLAGLQNQRTYIRYVNDTRHLKPCDFQPDFVPY